MIDRKKLTYTRFWQKVDMRNDDECWPWTAFRDKDGYGKFRDGGSILVASRVAWELYNQEELENRMALHTCDNPPCCNPNHIYPGDAKANGRDASRSGLLRNGKQVGETHTSAKLNASMVREIRARFAKGETPHGISRDYPVSAASLAKIRDGITWKRT